ncbi:Muskelin N-terminus-domain-containing protein [Mycena floridula]|nr:Muskelin N-terminus-domain-containing protein [Mycena floridula]
MTPPTVPLAYSPSCSGHSGNYHSGLIKVDNPIDQQSRWSGASQSSSRQWLLLELESPLAVVKTITFGKFHKAHPCNMRDFKVYVGMSKHNMTEVLHSGLKNDSISETFALRHVNEQGVPFPSRFVKIVPLSPHGQSYHISVWYIGMTGIVDQVHLEQVKRTYDEYRETTVLRHVLKHLRQRRLLSPYEGIISRSGLQVEHPLVTELHTSLVVNGDWKHGEHVLEQMSNVSLFDAHIRGCQPHSEWRRLTGTSLDGDIPSARGGHAMCIDHVHGRIYLFGGWDGEKSLDDFWKYTIETDKWELISPNTRDEPHAPGPRSCHKMVFDSKTESIYVLGRLGDADGLKPAADPVPPPSRESTPVSTPISCEFYRYNVRENKWHSLSHHSTNAPPLVFDHQMVLDCEAQILYVFGGRLVDGDWDSNKYSGLYSYNIRLKNWKQLQPAENTGSSYATIPPRFGHSMVLDPLSHTLFILAGQREDTFLSDMYSYDIVTQTATELYSNFTMSGGPDPCFTQRAVIDPELQEIYVFCGLTRRQPAASVTMDSQPNWVYQYKSRPGKWTRIRSEAQGSRAHRNDDMSFEEPCPRYASGVIYDPNAKMFYMHGGNAGLMDIGNAQDIEDAEMDRKRLDDFWSMKLARPDSGTVIRRATYKIRQQQFREMCESTSPIKALNFLQTEVSSVVDHEDPVEAEIFRSLLTHLLAPGVSASHEDSDDSLPPRKRSRPNTPEEAVEVLKSSAEVSPFIASISTESLQAKPDPLEGTKDAVSSARFRQRNEVFESLLEFVPDTLKQPGGTLLDLVDRDIDFLG